MRVRGFVLAVVIPVLLHGCASSGPSGATPAASRDDEAEHQPVAMDLKDPLAPTMLMREGQALVGEGRVQEGLARYRAAVKIQPSNPTIHNLIGQAELRLGDAAKALSAFNQALLVAPTYTDARNNRGAAYVALGQLSLAEADFLSALQDLTYSNRFGVLYNLGALYVGRGNLAAAEENLRRAAVPAGPVEAYVLLGQVQQRLDKPDLAEASFRAATQRAPERVDILLMLAKHLDGLGRRDEARQFYRRILEVGPSSPEAAEARAKMGS